MCVYVWLTTYEALQKIIALESNDYSQFMTPFFSQLGCTGWRNENENTYNTLEFLHHDTRLLSVEPNRDLFSDFVVDTFL